FFLLIAPFCPLRSLDHSMAPFVALRQTSDRLLPSSDAVWRKTFPLDTIGDEFPRPGIGVFQRASFGPKDTGIVVSSAVPRPFGPRKRSQSAAARVGTARKRLRRAIRRGCMAGRWVQGCGATVREIITQTGGGVTGN